MISLAATTLPPIPADADFQRLLALLELASNPDEVRKHLAEIVAARLAWGEAKREAEEALRDLKSARAEHDATIAKELAAHNGKLNADRSEHQERCDREMSDVRSKKAEADRLLEQTRADARAAAELKADFERRRALIKQAGL